MHEITKEYNEKLNIVILSCPDGCKITDWKEGDKIEDYSSFTVAYCPANTDTSIYHCISNEEDERLLREQLLIITDSPN